MFSSGHAFWERDRNFLSEKGLRDRRIQPFLLIFQH